VLIDGKLVFQELREPRALKVISDDETGVNKILLSTDEGIKTLEMR